MPSITKIYTTSTVETKHFRAQSGDAYTVIADNMKMSDGSTSSGPRQYMIKTAELEEFAELVIAARDAWRKAKEVEKQNNA